MRRAFNDPPKRHGEEDVGGVAGIGDVGVAAGVSDVGRTLGGSHGGSAHGIPQENSPRSPLRPINHAGASRGQSTAIR